MKYLQTWISKSPAVVVLLVMVCFSAVGQHNAYLAKADTLFKKKQFTQSFELYEDLFKQKKYSPAMLLKMAYIQEGLGHLSRSLFYLKLYYNVSHDERVLAKIDEVAANNKLEGYGVTQTGKLFTVLDENYSLVAGCFGAAIILMLAIAYSRTRKHHGAGPIVAGAGLLMILLALHINFSTAPMQGIVANRSTYIMTGPSAGASVAAIVGEGHQLEVLGHSDVWIKVKWLGKEAFVRDGALLMERL